jgi:hypothetical protein
MTREIKADTQELLNDTSAIKEDTAQILAEIARLQEQLPRDAQRNHASGFMLERYLENLTSYAETVYDTLSDNIDERRGSENGSIKRQRSTSPTTRPSSIAGEARITENNHAALPIAPLSPEDREGKFEAPEEYLIPEQKAADLARETTAQGILRRFSKRRRRQHADDHDNEDQSRFSGPPEIATKAESRPKLNHDHARRTISVEYVPQHVEQPRAQAALITTNSSGIKVPRELMREGAALRDHTGRSRSVSDMSGSDSKTDGHYLLPLHSHSPPTTVTQDFTLTSPPVPLKVDQQKRQLSEAAVARKPIAAHIAEVNSLRFDPQKHNDDVSQTENVYRRPLREPVGVGNLSPGTSQNQTDGNTPPQQRPATLKAKSREHAPRKRFLGRRARTEALREANDSREGEVDDSDDSYDSRSPQERSLDTKPASHAPRKRFSVRRARTEALRKAHESREGDAYYTDSDDSYDSRSPPESPTDTKPASLKSLFSISTTSTKPVHAICADIIRVLDQLNVEFTEIRGGFRCRHISSIDMERTIDLVAAELGGSLILEFDVLVVKVPLLSMHGIQFKKGRSGETWQYKNMADQILRKLQTIKAAENRGQFAV